MVTWGEKLSVHVRPYDKSELNLLKKLPCWTDIEEVIGDSVTGKLQEIPTAQFLLYSMFRDLDCNSVDDLKLCLRDQEQRLNRLFTEDESHVRTKPGFSATEHTGEANDFGIAFGLTVADLTFGTSEMDWKPIPVKTTKDNDYLGSNGKIKIDLEVKGSFVEDLSITPPTISNHKASIKEKKKAKGTAPSDTVRLGAIAAIGKDGTPIVRLVDPPTEQVERSPLDQQLLNRMWFLSRWITLISPRSTLAIALRGRIEALQQLVQIEELNRVVLVTGTGERIDITPYQTGQRSRFFASKSVVTDGPTGGVICPSASGVFFLGIMEDLLYLAVDQDFDAIRAFRRTPGTIFKTVRCRVPKSRKADYVEFQPRAEHDNEQYFDVEASGKVYYTAGGLGFGWLEQPN